MRLGLVTCTFDAPGGTFTLVYVLTGLYFSERD